MRAVAMIYRSSSRVSGHTAAAGTACAAPTASRRRWRRPCSRSRSGAVARRAVACRPRRAALAERFAAAWQRGDYAAMYALHRRRAPPAARAPRSRARVPRRRGHGDRAPHVGARPQRDGAGGDASPSPSPSRTRVFGTVRTACALPVTGDGEPRIAWRAHARRSPGCARGERLRAHDELPPRAALLARDGTPLATGPAPAPRRSTAAATIVGQLGADARPTRQAGCARSAARPTPRSASRGLERVFETRSPARPAASCSPGRACSRDAAPRQAAPRCARRSTPSVQRAAVAALAGRLGGVVALRPAHRRDARARRDRASRPCSRRARRSRSSR